jgi:hypothetical protein
MGLKFKKTETFGDIPVYQQTHEVSQSGYTLDVAGLAAGSILPAGTVIIADDATRKAKALKTAKVVEVAASDALVYKVAKGSQIAVGDNIGFGLKGKAYPVTAIDKSNANYDAVTVSTTLGAAAVDAPVFQSSTTGATNSALSGTPTGLLYEPTLVEANATITVVLRGTVYARRIPGVPADVKALLPLIIFSQSK